MTNWSVIISDTSVLCHQLNFFDFEKFVSQEPSDRKFFKIKNLSPWPSRNWSTTLVLVRVSVLIHLKKNLTKNSKIRFIAYSFGGNFWKQGGSHFKFSHSYRNHVINPQISTITLNTFENIDKKFHNDPRKTLGDMYIYSRGDLLLLHCLD